MLCLSGVVLVVVAGLVLSQDEAAPGKRHKLTTTREAQTSASASKAKAAADFPVIGYLEKRDRTITIKAGPKGPLYSVKTADGKILCENLTADQLRAQASELHEFLKTAVAGVPGTNADARVRIRTDASLRGAPVR